MLNKHKGKRNIGNPNKTKNPVNGESSFQKINIQPKAVNENTDKAIFSIKSPKSAGGTNAIKKKGTSGENKSYIFNDLKNTSLKVPNVSSNPKNGTMTKSGFVKLLHGKRVESGMARLRRTASVKGGEVLKMLHMNTGLKDLKDVKNGYSLLTCDIFKDIAEFVFRWSTHVAPYQKEWERIDEQYDGALSVKTPDECNGKFKESKLLFNMVNKVFDKLDVIGYDVEILSRQVDIDAAFEEAVVEMVKDKDVMDALVIEYGADLNINEVMDTVRNSFGSREFIEYIIRQGLTQVMDKAGVRNSLKNTDNGTYMSVLKKGVAFSYIEDCNNNDVPFRLVNIPLTNVVMDEHALGIRGVQKSRRARRGLIILDYDSLKDAVVDFPDSKEFLNNYSAWGLLPFQNVGTPFDTWYSSSKGNRSGQIGIYFDVDSEVYILMAGSDATVIDYKDGAMFPFKKNGKPVNPICMNHLFSNNKSIYKKGLAHFASQLTNIESITGNVMVKSFVHDNSIIDIMSVKEGGRNKARKELEKAEAQAIQGKRGIAISEKYTTGEEDIYGMSPLSSSVQWGAEKQQFIKRTSDEDIVGAGINMMEVNDNPYKTAQAIASESSVALAIASRIEEVNSDEWKNLIMMILDKIDKVNSKIPISTNNLDTGLKEVRLLMQPTMGIMKKLLKKLEIDVNTEFTDIVRPRDIQKARGLQNILPYIAPGSKAQSKIIRELASINGISVAEDDFAPPAQEQPQYQQGQPQGQPQKGQEQQQIEQQPPQGTQVMPGPEDL